MKASYYNYKELVEKATAFGATKEDRLNLFDWFDRYGIDYWHGEYYATNAPKQPVEIGIDAKMLAEILNSLKDYGYGKRALITIDADNATRPIFIETPDGSAKTMLCTCNVK